MKQLTAFLSLTLMLYSLAASGQSFRLRYDPSSIPELYNNTHVILEEKKGNIYQPYPGKFLIRAEKGNLKGMDFSYSEEDLAYTNGHFLFEVEINRQKIPLTLTLPSLTDIRFNFYTDSIKPILNYYVNVEGIFSSGKIYPLTEKQVVIVSDKGEMKGMEWLKSSSESIEKVSFTAYSVRKREIKTSATLYIRKNKDPRDAEGYNE